MKKLFFITLLLALSISVFAQSSEDSKLRIGVGAAYASEVDGSGVSIKAIYGITEKWETAVTYTHFFEHLRLTWDVVDIDGHFVFYDNGKKTNMYALTGLALTFYERETIGTILRPSEIKSGSHLGWNIGVGANFAVSEHFNIAPELRVTLFDLSYTRIGVTFQYVF